MTLLASKNQALSREEFFERIVFSDDWAICQTSCGPVKFPALYRTVLSFRGIETEAFEERACESMKKQGWDAQFAYVNDAFSVEPEVYHLWRRFLHFANITWSVLERDDYGLRELHASGVRPEVIVDVGAHIGTFALLARTLWPTARIECFEPFGGYEHAHECFSHLHGSSPRVTLHKKAVIGFVDDETENQILQSSESSAPFADVEKSMRCKHNSSCVSMSQIFADLAVDHIDLLKLDCEGAETAIFRELDKRGLASSVMHIRGEWHRSNAVDCLVASLSKTHQVTVCRESEEQKCDLFRCVQR